MPASLPSGELAVVALLADPLRGRLYRAVRHRHPLSREQAAVEVGISRGLAAFHLDKLVEGGLLHARYQAPPGRPPRVGRLPKVYEPSDLQLGISIPERRYDLAGEILLDAVVEAAAGEPAPAAASRIAMDRGAEIGEGFRRARGLGRIGPERALTLAAEALADHGYEPHRRDQRTVELRNCPFHALARRAPEVVCAVNRSLLEGLLRGLGDRRVAAVLAPRPDACCVELRAPAPGSRARRRGGGSLPAQPLADEPGSGTSAT
jgi:predicted ArsR family transcriptional regulator